MQSILLFIANLDNNKDKNIKTHYQLITATIWNFALKIAEKLFLFNDNAQEYAKKILFLELTNNFETILNFIHDDFKKHNILFDNNEIYTIFMESYNKSNDYINKKENIDFYN